MRVFSSLPLLSLALAASPALAVVEPCGLEETVRAAETAVQIVDITIGSGAGGACIVTGTVAHVLKGTAEVGQPVSVTVDCLADQEISCGGAVQNRAKLEGAEMIELHLQGGEVAGSGTGISIVDPGLGGTPQHVFYCEPVEG